MTEYISDQQAFNAMVTFLECYYKKTKSDDIGALLGSLQLHGDRMTWDPAAWGEWFECLKKVTHNTEHIHILHAFTAMVCYLQFYANSTNSHEIPVLLVELQAMPDGSIRNPVYWNKWIECVHDAFTQ